MNMLPQITPMKELLSMESEVRDIEAYYFLNMELCKTDRKISTIINSEMYNFNIPGVHSNEYEEYFNNNWNNRVHVMLEPYELFIKTGQIPNLDNIDFMRINEMVAKMDMYSDWVDDLLNNEVWEKREKTKRFRYGTPLTDASNYGLNNIMEERDTEDVKRKLNF